MHMCYSHTHWFCDETKGNQAFGGPGRKCPRFSSHLFPTGVFLVFKFSVSCDFLLFLLVFIYLERLGEALSIFRVNRVVIPPAAY